MQVEAKSEKIIFRHCTYNNEGEKIRNRLLLKQDILMTRVSLPQASPLFDIIQDSQGVAKKDPWELGLSPFDRDELSKLQLHIGIDINSQVMKMTMEEDEFGELFEMLDANFIKADWANEHFVQALKFNPDRSKDLPEKKQPKVKPKQPVNIYSTRVKVKAECLAFEMRKNSDEHIAEFILVDFRNEVDLFEHGLIDVNVKAQQLMILHNEVPLDGPIALFNRQNERQSELQTPQQEAKSLQVMCSHVMQRSELVVDDNFYLDLARDASKIQVSAPKRRDGFKVNIELHPVDEQGKGGDMYVDINLRKEKLYLRIPVLHQISTYTIAGLSRMDASGRIPPPLPPQQKVENELEGQQSFANTKSLLNEEVESGAKMDITIKLNKCLLILERPERSEKCLVCKTELEVRMDMSDPPLDYVAAINKSQYREHPFSWIQVKLKELKPYFCLLSDLENDSFGAAAKREIVQKLGVQLVLESYMRQKPENSTRPLARPGMIQQMHEKYEIVNGTSVKLEQTHIRVSINDMYIIWSITWKTIRGAADLGITWGEYAEQRTVENKKAQAELQGSSYPPARPSPIVLLPSINRMEASCQRLEALIIDEGKEGSLVPVIRARVRGLKFNTSAEEQAPGTPGEEIVQDPSKINSDSRASVGLGVNYFNKDIEEWEPFVEDFQVEYTEDVDGLITKRGVGIAGQGLSVNYSPEVAKCVNDVLSIWGKAKEAAHQYEQAAIGDQSDFESQLNNERRTKAAGSMVGNSKTESMFFNADYKETGPDKVSPYGVRNLTDRPISVTDVQKYMEMQKQNTREHRKAGTFQTKQETFVHKVPKCSQVDFAVDYQEFMKQDQSTGMSRSTCAILDAEEEDQEEQKISRSRGNPLDFFVQVQFDKGLTDMDQANLNRKHRDKVHRPFDNMKWNQQRPDREVYIVQHDSLNNKKVMTIRNQFLVVNRLGAPCKIKMFVIQRQEGKAASISTIDSVELKDGDYFPLADQDDLKIQNDMMIALRAPEQLGVKSAWSDAYSVRSLKDSQRMKTENHILKQGKSYCILRKKNTSTQEKYDCVDFEIVPPMIIQNRLPFPILYRVKRSNDDKMVKCDQQETVILQDILYTEDSKKLISLRLALENSGSSSQLDLYMHGTEEQEMNVPLFDKHGNSFFVSAALDSESAGIKIILYAKQMLISYADHRLAFFYENKSNLFSKIGNHKTYNGKDDHVFMHNETDHMYVSIVVGDVTNKQNASRLEKSEKIPIATAGGVGIPVVIPQGSRNFYYVATTQMYKSSVEDKLFSKIVFVEPQFVIVNSTKSLMNIAQSWVSEERHITKIGVVLNLDPGERDAFHWSNEKEPPLIKFRLEEPGSTFEWSSPFDIDGQGTIFCQNLVKRNGSGNSEKKFFKVTRKQIVNTTVIFIWEVAPERCPYLIHNKSKNLRIRYNQVQCGEKTTLYEDDKQHYVFQDFSHPLKLNFSFYDLKGDQYSVFKKKKSQQKQFYNSDLKQINKVNEIQLQSNNQNSRRSQIAIDQKTVYFSIHMKGQQRLIEFSDERPENKENDEDSFVIIDGKEEEEKKHEELSDEEGDYAEYRMFQELKKLQKPSAHTTISLSRIVVSLIGKIKNSNAEVVGIYLENIKWTLFQKGTGEDEHTLRVKRIQIDNQGAKNPMLPVILSPKCTLGKNEVPHDHKKLDESFYQCTKLRSDVENIIYVTEISFLLQELELNLELTHLMSILEFVDAVTESASLFDPHPVFDKPKLEESKYQHYGMSRLEMVKYRAESGFKPITNWATLDANEEDAQLVYIQKYAGSPIALVLTLFSESGVKIEQNKLKGSAQMLGNFGVKLFSINGAEVQVNAIFIENVIGYQQEVQQILNQYYTDQLKPLILRLLGSSDLFGNPNKFKSSIGAGYKELATKPKKGFEEGFFKGGMGAVEGVSSLATHTVGAAGGAVASVTGTLSKPLASLTMDEDYQRKKQIDDIKNKPTSLGDGLGKGFKGVGKGLLSGVTGVFTTPVKEAKKGGIGGFFKGIGKGAVGLIAKPATGVMDLVSKTGAGLEATTIGSTVCPERFYRYREPRAFYGEDKYVKPYDRDDALACQVFKELKAQQKPEKSFKEQKIEKKTGKIKLKKDYFVASYNMIKQEDGEPNGRILVITSQLVFTFNKHLYVSLSEKKKKRKKFEEDIWQVQTQYVQVGKMQREQQAFDVYYDQILILDYKYQNGMNYKEYCLESVEKYKEAVGNFKKTHEALRNDYQK